MNDYERGFKDGLETRLYEELRPFISEMMKIVSDTVKNIPKHVISQMEIKADVDSEKWIPCDDRMPKRDGDYLCVSNHEIKILPYMNGEFYCTCFDAVLRCCNSSVTHWMPLPAPPKKGEPK